jgi:hypothetical protein
MDAGIPQAEADDAGEWACILVFYRVCTRAFARTPASHGKTKSASRESEHRVCATCTQQL